MKIESILSPTDFSDPSVRALRKANQIARHFGSELYLVHVVAPIPAVATAPGPTSFDVPMYRRTLEESAMDRLEKITDEVMDEEVNVHPIVAHGNASDQITEIAEDRGVDLIVVATHGESGWEKLLFGSVAEKVVQNAKCPVLTIPAPDEDED